MASEGVRLSQRTYEFGVRYEASGDWIEEPDWDKPGTWYPDSDGLREARDMAGELRRRATEAEAEVIRVVRLANERICAAKDGRLATLVASPLCAALLERTGGEAQQVRPAGEEEDR